MDRLYETFMSIINPGKCRSRLRNKYFSFYEAKVKKSVLQMRSKMLLSDQLQRHAKVNFNYD